MSTQLSPPPDGDQNRTGPALGMVIAALTISCIFVGLRMYTRLFITKSARWDDWTICLALLGTIIGAGLDFPEVHEGYGRHQYYLNDHQIQEFKKYGYGEWIQTFFTLMFTKISICLLLLRISPNKKIIRPIQGIIAFLVVSNVVLSLLYILQCIPVDAAWDAERKKTAKCFSDGQVQRIIISQAIISIISDFILATFPILILYSVQIKLRQKTLLCALMGLGLITAACCIVRTVLNWQTVHSDQTWVGIDNFMWRCVEVNLGIGCACIPTLLPLYRLLRDKIGSLSTKQGSKSSIFSRLRRGWGPRTDAASDRSNLAPFSDEKRKSMERKGFVRHQDSDQNLDSNQRQAAAGVGRGILVETDLRVEGQTMKMQRLRDAQMQSKRNTDGSGEVWDGVSRLEVEDRV